MMMRQTPMNNTPAMNASSSLFVFLRFFIFDLPYLSTAPIADFPAFGVMVCKRCIYIKWWSVIIMGLHLLHIELLADSQTPCLFIDTQPIVSALNSDTMSVRYYGRFADFPALRHSESVMRGNDSLNIPTRYALGRTKT